MKLNDFHRINAERARVDFKPEHDLTALAVCAQEEIGELAQAVIDQSYGTGWDILREVLYLQVYVGEVAAAALGACGEKARKAHLTREDLLAALRVLHSDVEDTIKYVQSSPTLERHYPNPAVRKPEGVLDAVADATTYLSLAASKAGCDDLESLLLRTFNMVSDRAGSKLFVEHG